MSGSGGETGPVVISSKTGPGTAKTPKGSQVWR